MRTSRTVSQINPIEKVQYPKCNLKKQHEKQSLNLICITKTCKFHGPICSQCKKDHPGHVIVPIKTFVNNISQANKKLQIGTLKIQEKSPNQQKISIKNPLQKLQCMFNQVMGMLQYQVIELSEQIKKTQNKLIEQYQKMKINLHEQINKGQIMQEAFQYFGKKSFQDCLQYRQNIGKLLKVISINTKNNQIQIKSNQQEFLKTYEEKTELCKDNLFLIQNQIKQLYYFMDEKSMNQKIQKAVDQRPKTAMPGSIKIQNITFSSNFKANNIVLQKDGKIAKLKDNNGNKLVFFSNVISSKNYQTSIKILNLVGTIGVGVGTRDKLKQKLFKFEKNSMAHGVVMIDSQKYKYNYTQKTEDNQSNSFSFGVGDEIQISLKIKQKKIVFSAKQDKQKVIELSLKSLAESNLKDLQFCVCLNNMGDKVEII